MKIFIARDSTTQENRGVYRHRAAQTNKNLITSENEIFCSVEFSWTANEVGFKRELNVKSDWNFPKELNADN